MSTREKYHNRGAPEQVSRNELWLAVTTLANALCAENRHGEWPDRSRQRPMQRIRARRNGPRRFVSPPPRWFQRNPQPRQRRPHFYGNMRWGRNPVQPQRPGHPQDWRPHVHPRRGPPVPVIEAHQWHLQEDRKKRQPRGVTPRGTLRGGPERSAGDPRRKPPGGLCGGPEGQPRNHRPHPNLPRSTRSREAKRQKEM